MNFMKLKYRVRERERTICMYKNVAIKQIEGARLETECVCRK